MDIIRDYDDFNKKIKELKECDLNNPDLTTVQDTLDLVQSLIVEYEDYLHKSIKEVIEAYYIE